MNKQGTISSATSGFKWSVNNKALVAALQQETSKENSDTNWRHSQVDGRHLSGYKGVKSLAAAGNQTFSDLGTGAA